MSEESRRLRVRRREGRTPMLAGRGHARSVASARANPEDALLRAVEGQIRGGDRDVAGAMDYVRALRENLSDGALDDLVNALIARRPVLQARRRPFQPNPDHPKNPDLAEACSRAYYALRTELAAKREAAAKERGPGKNPFGSAMWNALQVEIQSLEERSALAKKAAWDLAPPDEARVWTDDAGIQNKLLETALIDLGLKQQLTIDLTPNQVAAIRRVMGETQKARRAATRNAAKKVATTLRVLGLTADEVLGARMVADASGRTEPASGGPAGPQGTGATAMGTTSTPYGVSRDRLDVLAQDYASLVPKEGSPARNSGKRMHLLRAAGTEPDPIGPQMILWHVLSLVDGEATRQEGGGPATGRPFEGFSGEELTAIGQLATADLHNGVRAADRSGPGGIKGADGAEATL